MEDALALVQTLLADDMAERNRMFAGQIRQLKARLVGENMWSSSFAVAQMQGLAIDEFKARQSLILQTWRRVLCTFDSAHRTLLLQKAAENAAQTLVGERDYLEKVVTSQPVGGLPNLPGFLGEICGLATSRMRAELSLPDAEPRQALRSALAADEVVELKPNFFGFGLNLRALWRKFLARVATKGQHP
jgi:hypothetical protein